jgi:hypothetical protein
VLAFNAEVATHGRRFEVQALQALLGIDDLDTAGPSRHETDQLPSAWVLERISRQLFDGQQRHDDDDKAGRASEPMHEEILRGHAATT